MQELLFQNTLILWSPPWILSMVISIGVFILVLLWSIRSRYKNTPLYQEIPQPYNVIEEHDPNYPSKTLYSLKKYLSERKRPYHVLAHTAIEIKSYIENPILMEIIDKLEHIEYSGKELTSMECRSYNQKINTALSESSKEL